MTPEAERARPGPTLPRFSRTARLVHRSVAVLMLACLVTAAVLYNGALAVPVGHRSLVAFVHVACGLALPVPVVLGLVSGTFRADLGRLNRFVPSDWRWLRSRSRRDGSIRVGKFNAGQKLNASLTAGAVLVLLGTGVLMAVTRLASLSWRTGATFVHDWFALALGLLVLGHVAYALRDPEARRGMRHGHVSRSWARAQHAAWAEEVHATEDGERSPGRQDSGAG